MTESDQNHGYACHHQAWEHYGQGLAMVDNSCHGPASLKELAWKELLMLDWKSIKDRWSQSSLMRWARRKPALDKPWDPQRTLWGLKVLAIVVFAAVIVAGYRPMSRQLKMYVSEKKAQVITAEKVRLVNAPDWMPPGFRHRLQELVAQQFARDPMDRQGPLMAVRALYESGWVAQVGYVQRVAGGVKVKALYREPKAFVKQKRSLRDD
ncbi:MAG: hypothetical protein HC898_00485 [Phycisphaerales bacterium]|nr:hypothetical protein [Phycisphaerales bacterium]